MRGASGGATFCIFGQNRLAHAPVRPRVSTTVSPPTLGGRREYCSPVHQCERERYTLARILIVNPDQSSRDRLARALERSGHRTLFADSATGAETLARSENPDVIIHAARGGRADENLQIDQTQGSALSLTVSDAADAWQLATLIERTLESAQARRAGLPVPSEGVSPNVDPTALPTLEEIERQYIAHVLKASEGNKTRAAKILGVDRRTLYRKLDRWGDRMNLASS